MTEQSGTYECVYPAHEVGFGVIEVKRFVVVVESADGVRRRVRELVEEAARRLDVQVNDPGKLECSDPLLPAALDEFLSLIGSTSSDLSRAWFPSELVGRELLSEGQEYSKRTLEMAGLPEDLHV